jgi:hypothetical protein
MTHAYQKLALLIAVLFAPAMCDAQNRLEKIQTLADLEQFTQTYHVEPRPDLVISALTEVDASGLAADRQHMAPLLMAFSCIFSLADDKQRTIWFQSIKALHEPARTVLGGAMSATPEQLLAKVPASPTKNDMNWAAYFITGDARYVDNVIAVLKFLGERKDLTLYTAAMSAEWSLADIASRDSFVKARIQSVAAGGDPELQPIAVEMQTKTPQEIWKKGLAVLAQQHKDGVW